MLKFKTFLCLFFIIISCKPTSEQKGARINNKSDFITITKDTLIKYNIEGISTEGAGADVNYVNGIINKSIINIYAGTWQAIIVYEFEENKIKVLETKYSYNVEIEDVKSDKDMHKDYEISYFIDFKGNVLGKEFPERIDVFKEFKDIVPFELQTDKMKK